MSKLSPDGKDPNAIRDQLEETRDRLRHAVGVRLASIKTSITGTIGTTRERTETVRQRMETVRQQMGTVRQQMGTVRQQMGTVRERVSKDRIRENPLGLLLGAAAVGFLLGSLLPATDIENERLGEIGDRLKQRAQASGGQILAQGKAVVFETIEAAKG